MSQPPPPQPPRSPEATSPATSPATPPGRPDAEGPPACSIRDLTVAYRDAPVLRRVDLDVPTGVVMGVVGPNGAGKSTLIKAALGLVAPLAGRVEFFGRPLARVRQRVGYVPQSTSVDWDFPTTALDVVTMGTYGRLGWFRRAGRAERQRAHEALEQTGMAAFANRQIGELSGGQRQRVFLARALAQAPDLYIMDEPFQGVDARSQQAIVDVLHGLRADDATVIIVHHDLVTVRKYCDHVTLLAGRVVASGPVDEAFTLDAIREAYDVGEGADGFLAALS
ncbi:manganese ABC transporter ATP-binding protein [Pseudoclavibacter endophyticus]|uniref:Metal ABC transporter ATP-binding protein n=1 Tax=Pseudoclavibacter endophyticus TaxID=1778590 RepID=A0A6H9WML0_9MICO|nr:metal ABC transporter ATP-binding protein [Pseudoclavibacter endophyticus]KAB1649268.1 metal ABC transporter ATP-binding protein [Pseudoclavibacter endophyticus]GGA63982.1 manganese ABC transporter ATP-binding protein [Pseudoclavibacter endophyticus]